jgi:hypothetical protein
MGRGGVPPGAQGRPIQPVCAEPSAISWRTRARGTAIAQQVRMNSRQRTTQRFNHASALATYAMGVAVLFAAGCGSGAVPNAQFADTKASVGAAQASGAQDIPEASLYLKLATDGVASAEAQMGKHENKGAALTLKRAKADAELAKSLTTKAKVKAEAEVALKRIDDLQDQNAPQI